MVGERGFEPDPPGPELWDYKLQVLYLVSLREQHTSPFSRSVVPKLYRSITEAVPKTVDHPIIAEAALTIKVDTKGAFSIC
jgi:hypothetical protein